MYLSKIKPLSIMVMCSLLTLTACSGHSDASKSNVNNASETFDEISIDLSNIQFAEIDLTTDETDSVNQAQVMLEKSHKMAKSEDTTTQNQAFNLFKLAVQGFIDEAAAGNAYAYNALAQIYAQDYQAFPVAFKAFHQMEQAVKFAKVVGYIDVIDGQPTQNTQPTIIFKSAQLLRVSYHYQNLKAVVDGHRGSATVDPKSLNTKLMNLFNGSNVLEMLSDINDSGYENVIASDDLEDQYEVLKTKIISLRQSISN
jgi:hypothetical protein